MPDDEIGADLAAGAQAADSMTEDIPADESDHSAVDEASMPQTEPHPAPIFDTGPHPLPLETQSGQADPVLDGSQAFAADSVSVAGHYQYLKWWKLVLVLTGVWTPAAAIGVGLYYWWFVDDSAAKLLPVFAVLTYVVVAVVASLLLAMVDHKPLVAAAAIAVLSAPFASGAGAAPLYGHYYCTAPTAQRCALGVLPY